jgi:hypothetical protein
MADFEDELHSDNGSPWTEADEQKLIKAVEEGKPKSYLFQTLPSRSPGSINYKIQDLKKKGLLTSSGAKANKKPHTSSSSSGSTASAPSSPAGSFFFFNFIDFYVLL